MRDQKLEALKTAIIASRSTRRGPFSRDLRQRLIAHAEQARAQGDSVEKISRELGLCSKTVHGWLSRAKPSQLRRVQVISERPTPLGGTLSMRGPLGTCVEGLSVDDVVAIWRKLGC
jgi:hypothetical protein